MISIKRVASIIKLNNIMHAYKFSKLPKSSEFSVEMGLEKQLKFVNKIEEKQQKERVFMSSTMIGLFCIFGGVIFIIFINEAKKRNIFVLNMMKTSYFFKVDKAKSINQILEYLQKSIKQSNFDSFEFLSTLQFISNRIELLNNEASHKFMLITQKMFFFNEKCKNNVLFLRICEKQLEKAFITKSQGYDEIANILLSSGSIKQIYLAIQYLNQSKAINKINEETKTKTTLNLQSKIKKRKIYYDKVFQGRTEDEFPQLVFKKDLQDKWIEKIKGVFDISEQV